MKFEIMPFIISFKLALITTLILFAVCLPLSLFLSYRRFRGAIIIEAVTMLPMALPPTVIGFYLLALFSPRSACGGFMDELFGINLLFSFKGLVVASCVHALPFMLQPLRNGCESVSRSLLDAARTLGKSRMSTLARVILPNMQPFIATGLLMTFVHVLGEFGVVLMVGGSIPGETRVASVALYEQVDAMRPFEANVYAAILAGIGISACIALGYARRGMRVPL
jgi:molybdate transport system permease protein